MPTITRTAFCNSITDTSDTTATCGTYLRIVDREHYRCTGHVTQETLGNNVQINRSYDAVTSWLTQATAGVGGGTTLLNQSYLQDLNGDITQRQNGTLTESFAYDLDYRLTWRCARGYVHRNDNSVR